MKVYLDNAATTQMHPEVIDTMVDAMQNKFGNPSSTHVFGREVKALVEQARKKITQYCGVNSGEIIFTSCGTEANNLTIRSCVKHLGVERIITSHMEHKCVAETVAEMGENGIEINYINVNADGDLDYIQLEQILFDSDKKTLVSLMHANNEVGNIYDIDRIGKICHKYNALFHSDMVQTLGHYPINLKELPVDFASSSAHKYHGPKGVGFLYIKNRAGFKAQITGGGQERGLRSGTENAHGIIGMGKAFELANENYVSIQGKIKALKSYTIKQLKTHFPGIQFNGKSESETESLYTLLNVLLPFRDSLIGFELDLKGIACSQGSACSSGATSTSKVLSLLLSEEELQTATPLRISFSEFNTQEEIDYLVQTLLEIQEKQKKREHSKVL